jgi:hypothetical protein
MNRMKMTTNHRKWERLLIIALVAVMLVVPLAILQGNQALAGPAVSTADPTLRLETAPASGDVGDIFETKIYADGISAPGLE